jgi:type I restriction enzyme S subunit
MSEWIKQPLDSLAEIVSGGTPSRDNFEYWGGDIPWVTPTDITACTTNFLSTTSDRITRKGLLNSSAKMLPIGSILFTSRATVGLSKIAATPVCTNQGFKSLIPKSEIDGVFLFYQIQRLRGQFERFAAGSTFPEINKKDTARVLIPHPINPLAQQKIAAILTSIDTAIEKTEALIEKYQQIKAGMMHDLFTRGVFPNGQLRPPREQAPELYQETAIGWIPKDWGEPVILESLLAPIPNNIRSGPFGSTLLKHELVENGIPFLGIDNIHVEHFDSHFRRFVSERKFRELARYQVRPRDVVITIMGTIGRCCVIPENCDIALSSKHLWTMTFDTQKVLPELICWQLNYASWVKAWFRRATQGGIMDAIQSSTLKTLKLPQPSLDEQILICNRYKTVSERIQKENAQLDKLRQQKLGLMQDLLTGKVPVKIQPENSPEPEALI